MCAIGAVHRCNLHEGPEGMSSLRAMKKTRLTSTVSLPIHGHSLVERNLDGERWPHLDVLYGCQSLLKGTDGRRCRLRCELWVDPSDYAATRRERPCAAVERAMIIGASRNDSEKTMNYFSVVSEVGETQCGDLMTCGETSPPHLHAATLFHLHIRLPYRKSNDQPDQDVSSLTAVEASCKTKHSLCQGA